MGPVPPRVDARVETGLLELVDAVEEGWPATRAGALLELDERRARRWRTRGSGLDDGAPGREGLVWARVGYRPGGVPRRAIRRSFGSAQRTAPLEVRPGRIARRRSIRTVSGSKGGIPMWARRTRERVAFIGCPRRCGCRHRWVGHATGRVACGGPCRRRGRVRQGTRRRRPRPLPPVRRPPRGRFACRRRRRCSLPRPAVSRRRRVSQPWRARRRFCRPPRHGPRLTGRRRRRRSAVSSSSRSRRRCFR